MGVKVATCLHWSQMRLPHPPPSSPHCCSYQYSSPPSPPTSSTSSRSSSPASSVGSRRRRRRSFGGGGGGWVDGSLTCRVFCPGSGDRSPFLDGGTGGIFRSKSVDRMSKLMNTEQGKPLRRAASASLTESFFPDGDDEEDEEEFVRRLQELALRCQEGAAETDSFSSDQSSRRDQSAAGEVDLQYRDRAGSASAVAGGVSSSLFHPASSYSPHGQPSLAESATPPPWLGIRPEPPDWVEEGRREIVPAAASVERNAASVDLPLSLRILKRKKRWESSERWIREAGESAACSVQRAISSLVFIIRELQSYALQVRSGALFCEDSLQEVLSRVHGEVHASFCWLFSHIFACTPTLMLSVMLLLANFTVYSMGHSVAVGAPSMAPSPPQPYAAATATLLSADESQQKPALETRHDAPSISSSFSSGGKTASVGVNGGSGGGGKVGPLAGAADDGRWRDGYSALQYQSGTIIPDGISTLPSTGRASGSEEADQTAAAVVPVDEEGRAWSRIVEEAARMQAMSRDEALMDHETLQHFVSPVVAEVVPDVDYPEYLLTELKYQQAIGQDPSNPMLLCNFAQFLYVVAHDHDRAEYYFKKAAGVQPPDAEALGRYANFLWLSKNDLGAAEEAFLEAIAADPGNTVHAASYAHFLWNTGGEDTCYPLSGPDEEVDGEDEVF